MKKKLLITIYLYLLSQLSLFGQNSALKYYSDHSKDFKGYAVAQYYGNLKDYDILDETDLFEKISAIIGDTLQSITKLTKNNNWLLYKAMNEWNYEKGEIYLTILSDSLYSTQSIVFIVVINSDNNYLWKAYSVNENDMEKLADIFTKNESKDFSTVQKNISDEYTAQREILDWYTSLGSVRTDSNDNSSIILVDVAFGFKLDDKLTKLEIEQNTIAIKDFIRNYFTNKSIDSLKPQNEINLKTELRNELNDKIISKGKIIDISFLQLDIIEK